MKQSLNNEVSMMAHAMDSFYVKRKSFLIFFCHHVSHSLPHQDGNNAFQIIKTQA
jgi:hypothetical protein